MTEKVDHPAHYGGGDNPYEAIKVIEAWGLGFCDGNAIKYVCRWRDKNGVEDLRKAIWYLNRLVEQETARLAALTQTRKQDADAAATGITTQSTT